MVHYYWNWAKVNISRLKFLPIKYRLPWKYGESIHLIKSGSEEAMVNNLKCSLVISLWNQSKRAFAANKTKSIFYTRQFIRQFVNMYSERVFISRIVFNRRHIYNHWKACLFFWGIFIWVNMERLTVDSLKSKFMEPEFMEPYDLILMISDNGFHNLPNKVHHDKGNHTQCYTTLMHLCAVDKFDVNNLNLNTETIWPVLLTLLSKRSFPLKQIKLL